MSVEQITDLIDNKGVLVPKKDIPEVKNVVNIYDNLARLNINNENVIKGLC